MFDLLPRFLAAGVSPCRHRKQPIDDVALTKTENHTHHLTKGYQPGRKAVKLPPTDEAGMTKTLWANPHRSHPHPAGYLLNPYPVYGYGGMSAGAGGMASGCGGGGAGGCGGVGGGGCGGGGLC